MLARDSGAMTTTHQRATFAILAGLTLAGTLAGCAAEETAAAQTDAVEEETTTPTPTSTPTDAATATTQASTYTDGTYSASGTYQAPSGTESIDVTVTVADDIVTAVTVSGSSSNPEASQYQSRFSSAIAAVIVGQDLGTISVDRVAGSSLTTGGFTTALEAIRAEAA